ncbi:MAG: hypothetical protein ACI4VK_03780 [Candidatus Coproplasma sp.]
MFKILRIISCIISALCCAACVFVFIYAGIVWGICTLVGAGTFFALTVLFKRFQEDEEEKQKNGDGTSTDNTLNGDTSD